MTESEAINKFEKAIIEASAKYSKMYNVEYDDLYSEICLKLIKYVRCHSSRDKTIANYIYRWAYWYCCKVIENERPTEKLEKNVAVTFDSYNIENRDYLEQFRPLLTEPEEQIFDYLLQGFNVTDIAKKIGVTKKRVHYRYKQIIEKIRKRIGIRDDGPESL